MKLKIKSEKYTIIFEGKPEELNSIRKLSQIKIDVDLPNESKDEKNIYDVDKMIIPSEKAKSCQNIEYDLWKTDVECPFCGNHISQKNVQRIHLQNADSVTKQFI